MPPSCTMTSQGLLMRFGKRAAVATDLPTELAGCRAAAAGEAVAGAAGPPDKISGGVPHATHPDQRYSRYIERVCDAVIRSRPRVFLPAACGSGTRAARRPTAYGQKYEITTPDWRSIRGTMKLEQVVRPNRSASCSAACQVTHSCLETPACCCCRPYRISSPTGMAQNKMRG
jgi:hypothetical protein